MKYRLIALAAAGLLVSPLAVRPLAADEVPHLDFVRGLRARQYPDLALDYLDRLRKSNPAPEIAALLPLETAKVRLDLAAAESDRSRRLELYNKARAEFDEFIKKAPDSPLASEARLEQTRLTRLQAAGMLSRALQQDNPSAAAADALQARQTFKDAAAQLADVFIQLDKQLAAPALADPKTPQDRAARKTVEAARQQAELDQALNFIDQAQTYTQEGKDEVLQQRAATIKNAIPLLEKLAARDPRSPIRWQAQAWLGHCYHQNGDPFKARKALGEVIDQPDPSAQAGRRLARYFRMLVIQESPEPNDGDPLVAVRDAAERWLRDFPGSPTSPEAAGVRYLLAQTYLNQGLKSKDNLARGQLLARARELCRDLEKTENDYLEKARRLKIDLVREEGGFKIPIAKLATFDDCMIRAQFEAYQANEAAVSKEVKDEDRDKARKARLDGAVEALARALKLAQDRPAAVTPAELSRARSLLTGYYLFTNRYKEAVRTGEEAARSRPPTSQSAATAVYVLQSYSDLINAALRDGTPLADLGDELKKLHDLADYMEATWPGDLAGDLARHQRGLMLVREKKLPEAVAALDKVSLAYPGAVFAKYQLAMAANQAAQDAATQARTDPAARALAVQQEKAYEAKALDALTALPPLPEGADDLTTGVFLQGKVELGRALYKARRYADIDKLVDPLLADLGKGAFKIPPERLAEARANLVILRLFARYGEADAAYTAGDLARVKQVTDPIVEALKKGEYPELQKNPTLRWGLMGLTLRTSLQEGNTPRAQEILQAMQKFAAEGEGQGGAQAVLQQLAVMVERQVRDVKKKKDKALLDKTVAGLGAFLDELRKQQKAPTPEFLRLLSDAYSGLGLHEVAADLAGQVPEPRGTEDQAPPERQVANYRYCRLQHVHELRLAGKLDEAEKALAEVRATPWGKDFFEAEKERIHLLAARGKPGAAYTEWNRLVASLVRRITQPGVRDQYFDCYYNLTESYLKYALGLSDPKKKEEGIRRAAGFIVKLESSYPDFGGEESKGRFDDLLDREPALKEQVQKLKGVTPEPPPEGK